MKFAWTDERKDALRRLQAEGHSYSQIAVKLGAPTKNCVIGAAHRLGIRRDQTAGARAAAGRINGRKGASKVKGKFSFARGGHAPRPDRRALAEGPSPGRSPAAAPDALESDGMKDLAAMQGDPPPHERIADILKLNEQACRWPLGTPGHADFAWCGRKRKSGSVYCVQHTARAYRPQRKD